MTDPIYTHRTRDGRRARIICNDVKNASYPVVAAIEYNGGEAVEPYTKDFRFNGNIDESDLDLFEYNPWSDVAVDTPIWVCISDGGIPFTRHFAKYENGKVFAWINGRTSHTETEMFECDYEVTLTRP